MVSSNRIVSGNRGFSLVELIVSVAIIGILAVLAIPQYKNLRERVYEAEANSVMSGLLAAEKGFFAEYGRYHTDFRAVGFAPEGGLHHNVGFSRSSAYNADRNVGFNTFLGGWVVSAKDHCADAILGGGVPGNQCRLLYGPDNNPAPPIPAGLAGLTYSPTDGYGFSIASMRTAVPDYALNENFSEERSFASLLPGFAQPLAKLLRSGSAVADTGGSVFRVYSKVRLMNEKKTISSFQGTVCIITTWEMDPELDTDGCDFQYDSGYSE